MLERGEPPVIVRKQDRIIVESWFDGTADKGFIVSAIGYVVRRGRLQFLPHGCKVLIVVGLVRNAEETWAS